MDRPLVSFILFAYNQEQFIREAMDGALSQTYSPLEIIVSDDCSTDSTLEIINEMVKAYQGPHKIIVNRNDRNLGLAGNINNAFEMAAGEFFVVAAGDDISVPERTVRLVERWTKEGSATDLVCSYFEEIDVHSVPTGFVKKSVLFLPNPDLPVHEWQCGATGACAAYSRKLYDKYGRLDPRVISEDWVYSFRAWLESGCALVEEPLVKHRLHDGCSSLMHKRIRTESQSQHRRKLRKNILGDKLARGKEWLKACSLSGKMLDDRVTMEFDRWIGLMELQWNAYDSSRIRALGLAFRALSYRGGTRRAASIVLRSVLGIS